MPYLGTIGNIYMSLLLVILIIGLGMLAKKMLAEPVSLLIKEFDKSKKTKGRSSMFNKWLRLAVIAFLGIVISGFVLGLLTSGQTGMAGHQHGSAAVNSAANPNTYSPDQMNTTLQRMNLMMTKMDNVLNNMYYYNNYNVPYSTAPNTVMPR